MLELPGVPCWARRLGLRGEPLVWEWRWAEGDGGGLEDGSSRGGCTVNSHCTAGARRRVLHSTERGLHADKSQTIPTNV